MRATLLSGYVIFRAPLEAAPFWSWRVSLLRTLAWQRPHDVRRTVHSRFWTWIEFWRMWLETAVIHPISKYAVWAGTSRFTTNKDDPKDCLTKNCHRSHSLRFIPAGSWQRPVLTPAVICAWSNWTKVNFFSNLISFPVPMRLEQHLASRRKKLRNKLMQILCKVANHIDIECPPLPRDWQCRFRILCAWAYHRNQRRTPSPPWWTWQWASSIWDCLLRFVSISLADEVLEHWVLRMCKTWDLHR